MKLSDTQTRLYDLIVRRNALRIKLSEEFNPKRADQSAGYFRVVGELDGLDRAIEAFRDIEPVGSLEYLASDSAQSGGTSA